MKSELTIHLFFIFPAPTASAPVMTHCIRLQQQYWL